MSAGLQKNRGILKYLSITLSELERIISSLLRTNESVCRGEKKEREK